MVLLTLALLSLFGLVHHRFTRLHDRLATLDLAEHLHTVIARLDQDTVKRNRSLADALRESIAIIESNPRLHEAHWNDLRRLKDLLK